ncbi:hypothetical protein N9N67_11265, partial [Bacteriovoracaceae bacterium]|nr:hypothetical protein [Bacteriovoracaceae bacterium]
MRQKLLIILFSCVSLTNGTFALKLCRMQDHIDSDKKFVFTLEQEKVFKEVPFIPHGQYLNKNNSKWDNWLGVNIYFSPIKNLKNEIEKSIGKNLNGIKPRVEAHITILTPPEYNDFIEPSGLTMQEINKLAEKDSIQKLIYKIIGIGSACFDSAESSLEEDPL